ncbi:AAEL003935-PA [Aedes aegypti]|uniref:DNA polymerase delta subunit 3 n=2 Tax=Aedes aegypti TaxID=7159 RepID=A0A1S4F6A0_AEDAE|nr:neurofilament heavy polypeptide [Aedes aegypti]EAT44727.1 AAEL003935-PA [Aedes aegypti]
MDATLEKSCIEEISHTVLDAQQKISVRSISNNYGLNFLDAVKVLQKWIDNNSGKANLLKEFIVRGIDAKRGGAFITVASEKKLKTIQDKASQISSVLYAVEVQSESSRPLHIPEEQEFKVINLPLASDKRDVKVFIPAEPTPASTSVKQESKPKINSMFAASASKPKQETPKPTSVPVKEEKTSPPAKQEAAKTSPPQKSPTKGSPSKKKDAKKPVSGKASIASFFSNKPTASKPAPSTPANSSKPADVKKEKPSPKEDQPSKKEKVHEDTPRWKRMISDESDGDDVVPNTPQETKEPKKRGGKKSLAFKKGADAKGRNPSKRSRILQVEDSSEEEEDEDRNMREKEEKTIEFDTEEEQDVQMEEKKQLTPEKPVENDSNSLNRKGRAKVKKLVTRNFMDEEGYMTTIKEYVMVSASEDEAEEESRTKSSSDEKKKTDVKDSAPSGKKKAETKTADKKAEKVTPPAAKTKQGSIMSFFSKK